MNTLLPVIHDYLNEVQRGIDLIEKEAGRRDLMAAWRDGSLKKSGRLSNGTEYEFHGVGCCFYFDDHSVDFDFSVDGRSDGFDSWRLWQYSKQFPSRYPDYQSKENVEKDFEEISKNGLIVKKYSPQSPLYFLAGN